MNADPEDVLSFWLDEVGPARWYASDAALDATCRDRFLDQWEAAGAGGLDGWVVAPRSSLALTILLDQLPRNMFRGEAAAFATDPKARAVAKDALARGHDRRVAAPGRLFFYMPLVHSESVADQARAVRLFVMRGDGPGWLKAARAHRAVIRRFGRFPFRNAALQRHTTAEEAAWLDAGGYSAEVKKLA
jgi:uncharacterized protein (DUF924 family)